MLRRCKKCNKDKPLVEFYSSFDKARGKTYFRGDCRACISEEGARNRALDPEAYRLYAKAYYAANREKLAEASRAKTPKDRIDNNISCGVGRGIRRGSKNGRHSFDLLGYSLNDLTAHLEAQFWPGMTWDNYGRGGWHIDHVRPLATFSYETPDDPEFREAWALSNLQPLWEWDNIAKGAKWTPPEPANDNSATMAAA